MSAGGDLVFVGDVHLHRHDEDLDAFVAFVSALAPRASTVVLMGDLFDLWIGRRETEGSHHRAVADALAGLRRRGTSVLYVEGNRDYRVAAAHLGTSLDACTDEGIALEHGRRRIFAIHGDLANVQDRQYRAWRRFSRSAPVWALFRLVPPSRRLRVAEGLEARMRRTNLRYKGAFPEARVRDYAASFLARGFDTVVLGHFHVERDLSAVPPSPPGRILVLPAWKDGRRFLRVGRDGGARFEAAG